MTHRVLGTMLFAALVIAVAPQSPADECQPSGKCQMCGSCCNCHRTCRLVPGTKKVITPCYSCKCEEICIPDPSTYCGCTHEMERDPCDGCPKRVRKEHWTPSPCGKIITVHKLEKREITKEVPAYSWEVQNICCNCARRCAAQNRAVPREMIANDPPPLEDEPVAEMQTSADQAVNAQAARPPAPESPSAAIKQKLMSLLGK